MIILGTDDSINTCDCCGKSYLKYTVTVEVNGEIMHYGSTCATRHTGLKFSQIRKQIVDRQVASENAASEEFRASKAYKDHCVKLRELHLAGVKPGKEFLAAQSETNLLACAKKREIANKYSIEIFSFH